MLRGSSVFRERDRVTAGKDHQAKSTNCVSWIIDAPLDLLGQQSIVGCDRTCRTCQKTKATLAISNKKIVARVAQKDLNENTQVLRTPCGGLRRIAREVLTKQLSCNIGSEDAKKSADQQPHMILLGSARSP